MNKLVPLSLEKPGKILFAIYGALTAVQTVDFYTLYLQKLFYVFDNTCQKRI